MTEGGVAERELAERLGARAKDRLHELQQWTVLRKAIESFWLRHDHRRAPTWVEHRDISDVMLATCLAPDGFLAFERPKQPSLQEATAAPPPG